MTNKPENTPAFPCRGITPLDNERLEATGMSIATYAAIHLRLPISEHDWLNEAILKAKRDDFATAALQGLIIAAGIHQPKAEIIVDAAKEIATTMLKEREI